MKFTEIAHPDKKFIESFFFGDGAEEWEVQTDQGWSDVKAVGKTVPYRLYSLKTENHELLCADEHIVFEWETYFNFREAFVKDLTPGKSQILTQTGIETVLSVSESPVDVNMYDLQLGDEEKRYWTNGILSHNSMFLCNLACQGVRMGYNVAYISLEMADTKVVKRLGCNLLNVPSAEYDSLAENPSAVKKKFSNISSDALSVPGALRVKEFPTSTAGVPDVESWLKRMEEMERLKFKLVVVDYIGIMKNWRNPNTENMYMKIKQIAEDLRAMAMRNGWCVVTASQFNRGAYNTNDVTIEQIAESAGLVHTVDGMFGIIQDEMMYMNSEYLVKTLANRDGGLKNSKKRFVISYDYMRISEDMNSQIIEGR